MTIKIYISSHERVLFYLHNDEIQAAHNRYSDTGPDLDNKVSLRSCSADGEGSDNGGSCGSDTNCFSTICLEGHDDACEEGPPRFEAVEGMELEFGGSPEGLELG